MFSRTRDNCPLREACASGRKDEADKLKLDEVPINLKPGIRKSTSAMEMRRSQIT